MLSLGIPELLVLLAAVLMGYGSWRIPQLIRSADESRRSFQSGARLPTDQPGEPVGITLRQIQFRGSVPLPEAAIVLPAGWALEAEGFDEEEGAAIDEAAFEEPAMEEPAIDEPDPEPDTEPEVAYPAPPMVPVLTFSGARRVAVPAGPAESAGIDGWEDVFV